MKRQLIAVMLTLSFCGAAQANVSNVLANGDFETELTNWTYTGHVATYAAPWFGGGNANANGKGMATFNAGNAIPDAVLSQTFGTVIGATYDVSFAYGTNSGSQSLDVAILANDGTKLVSGKYNGTGGSTLGSFTFSFVASTGTTTIKFADVSTNHTTSVDGLLDNVKVMGQEVSSTSAVPEPASIALLGAGLMGLVSARRKHRKS